MRVHPRTRVVQRAELEINEAINQVATKYELTIIELMQILATSQLHYLKYALREERHPDDPDKGGDEA